MLTKNFKKFHTKIVFVNFIILSIVFSLSLLALFNKSVEKLLFEKNKLSTLAGKIFFLFTGMGINEDKFLFDYVFFIMLFIIFSINVVYYKQKRKYEINTGILEKEEKKINKRKKIAFSIFLSLAIINIFIIALIIEEIIYNKFKLYFSAEFATFSVLALIANISLILYAKFR